MAIKISGSTIIDDSRNIVSAGVVTATSAVVGSGVTINADGIEVTGIISATSFSGSAVGLTSLTDVSSGTYGDASNVAQIVVDSNGRITGISDVTISAGISSVAEDTTPQLGGNLDLNSNDITGTGNLNITGIATFSGNVTIGGTLTCEDVTNIDSVGLITARTGINVLAGGINVTGINTADAFAGFDYLKAPHGTTVNYSVTIASKTAAHRYNGSGSSNGYLIDGVESPFLTLTPGRTYRFTLSSSDMSSHPFRFYLEADKTTAYTTNVTSTSTYTEIVVTDETPTVLHYQCSAHSLMGNAVQTNSNKVNTPYLITGLDGANITGTVTATTFSGSGANLTSIPNSALTNDSVSFGGVSLDLGASDATPAFDLTNATAYPYTSLTGITTEIVGDTTPQLGGNLDINSKIITGTGGINVIGVVTATSFSGSAVGLTSLTNVSSGTYGDASNVAQIVVDSNGRITGISDVAISGGGGDTVSITTNAADILSVSSGAISADDAGADKIVFWDDSEGKLTYLTVGTNLTISGTTISASAEGGGGGSIGIQSGGTEITSSASTINFVGTGITMSDDGSTTDIHIPVATRTTTRTVATNAQTTFSATYTVGYVDVYLNGSKLDSTEFTATNGTSVVLGTGASTGDIIETVAQNITASVDLNGLANLVDDTTPQLGGDLDLNSNDITGTGDINITGTITSSGSVTANVTGNVTGNADTATTATTATNTTVADESSDTSCFPLFVTAATGDLPPKSGSNLTFDSSAGILGATTFAGNVDLSGLLKEGVNITAGKLSANLNIDLANGMVHLFTTTEDATALPNIRVDGSTSLNASMSTGEAITVVLITTTAAAGYSAELQIDGSAVTEEWLGGSAPSTGGSGGYDVYTYNIIKTADATFVVLANLVNFA